MSSQHGELQSRIASLKRARGAVLLGHYYARPEVQDVCDYVGDSLGLSRQAASSEASLIVFCGVHFMAETASVLSPDRRVLLPHLGAGCSLASSITGEDVRRWREAHPEGVVISYVNTTAEVKSQTDCCCTSANAVRVVERYGDAPRILFLPDSNLGRYVMRRTGIEMELWAGACHVHDRFALPRLLEAMSLYPDAEVLVHPESAASWQDGVYDNPRVYIGSTSGMIQRAKESSARRLVVVTEEGTLHQMSKAAPGKELILIGPDAVCEYMKYPTLSNVLECLEREEHEVRVPAELRARALMPISRMLEVD